MGLKIGKLFQKYGEAMGKIAKGVAKFAQSPLGKLAIQVGLTVATGGVGGVAGGLGMLGKLGSFSKVLGTFSGFASKFLGPASNLLSGSGLAGLSGFLNKTSSTGDLLGILKQLVLSRASAPAMDPTTEQMARQNLFQLVAHRHAELLRQAA